MAINNKQKALIHVAKSKTGMTDDEYRAMLDGLGVTSSKELDHAGFEAAMRQFKSLGFKSTGRYRRPASSKDRLKAKVIAIRTDLNLTEGYLDGMVKNMKFKNRDGEPIASWHWLDANQLHKLVAALTYHQRRRSG